jgi:2-oxoglutarate dehydrogenase E1 component
VGRLLALPTADEDPRRGKTGVDVKTRLKEIGAKITTVPSGFNAHKTVSASSTTAQGDRNRRRHRLGTGEALAFAPCSTKASRSACRARTRSAAPSRSAIRCSSTRRPKSATRR